MDVLSKLWLYVFGYLNESELVFAAQVCFEWWKIIFRGPFMKDVELPEEIDLSGSGNLYQFIPLRLFTETPEFIFHEHIESSFPANSDGRKEFGKTGYF